MDLSRFTYADSVTIAAPPEQVWAAISDITRMGEFSPVCTGGDWDKPAGGTAAGAWFTGHNDSGERTWSTRCRVDAAQPGRAFSFVNYGPEGNEIPLVRWQFDLQPAGDGTNLKETWRVLDDYDAFLATRAPDMDVVAFLEGMAVTTREGISTTLANLKKSCES
jgi:uncharacterized protein YndB with AHSA1/START domain